MEVLREMFAGAQVDDDVLSAVLVEADGDVTRAVDLLLPVLSSPAAPAAGEARDRSHGTTAQALRSEECPDCTPADGTGGHDEISSYPDAQTLAPPPSPSTTVLPSHDQAPSCQENTESSITGEAHPTLRDQCVGATAASVLLPALRRQRRVTQDSELMRLERGLRTLPHPLILQVWRQLFHTINQSGPDAQLFADAVRWFLPLCPPEIAREVTSSISHYRHNEKITDGIMEQMFLIIRPYPFITEMHINGCANLIYPQISSPHLVKLSLKDCLRINDLAVQWLLERSTSLQELDLGGCHRLTSPHIESESLIYVNMVPCKGLMFPQVRNSPKLENVIVPDGCRLDWRRPEPATSLNNCSSADVLSVSRILACSDYYEILSLPRDATLPQITKQYRTMALKLHPDKNEHPESGEAFKKISEAFACLSDAGQRKMYDDNRGAEIRPEILKRAEVVLAEVQAYIFLHVYKTLFGALGGM